MGGIGMVGEMGEMGELEEKRFLFLPYLLSAFCLPPSAS
jgi:hypothetical protein